MREDEIIRVTSMSADEAAPRRSSVARVYAERAGTSFKVLAYRLRKAILGNDHDALVKAASAMTKAERLQALEQFEVEDELRKSSAMPADTKPGWTAAFWLPRNWNFNLPHADPNAPPSYRAPKRATVPQETTGPRRQVERGAVVHWTAPDGNLYHGKAKSWGTKGLVAITADGDEHGVVWADVRVGVHPSAMEEHEVKKSASDAAERDRVARDTTAMLCMDPADRAEWFRRRHGDDL